MAEVFHNTYRIKPSARVNDLGRWMPVIAVEKPRGAGASAYAWTPRAVVGERYKTRAEAERRSLELAKQMIDRGDFKERAASLIARR